MAISKSNNWKSKRVGGFMEYPVSFKKWVAPLLLCGLLIGCATAPVKLNTPSGRPEVTIFGATKKKISDAIINRELSKGWDLKSQTNSLLVFTKKNTGLGAQLLFGSRYDSVPEGRITFTLVEIEDGIRVLLKGEIVTNPGSAFERNEDVTAINAAEAEASQGALGEIKAGIEAAHNRDGVVALKETAPAKQARKVDGINKKMETKGYKGFKIISFNPRWEDGRLRAIGEIMNVGETPGGPHVEVIARDENGELVASTDFWPNSVNNIPPGETRGIAFTITEDDRAKSAEIKIIGVNVW